MTHVYCPECGFQSPEAANFCARCGAALLKPAVDEITQSLELEMTSMLEGITGPALVVRTGGGREGDAFPLAEGTIGVGRSPECPIFLDDVTVSRHHAEIVRSGDETTIRDLGSLNGTFVNRRRIDTSRLEDDDEVQIGKYRMTFLIR
ncbi:MAG: FHA domain-containing protein [Gaiella sp.]